MKSFKLNMLLLLGVLTPCFLYAQPSASPGAGFEWVMTGSASYIDNGATVAGLTFGDAGDTDPVDCSSYCGGNCDGDALLEKLVFGGTALPASSCEQRAVNLVHWNNANPDSGVSSGATSGTVHLATAAQIEIIDSGSKIVGSNNKGFIIGGNGPGNFSEFNTQVDYSMNWHVDEYALTGGTGLQTQQFTWNWGEPGGGAELEMSGWNGYSTAPFETIGGEVMTVPLASIIETGGSLEVVFEGNMEMFLSRNFGNADGKVQTVPSIEGEATYTVNYDIWEIQAILPVELIAFDGQYKNDEIHLNWSTATEINHEKFIIEKSDENLIRWNSIGEIKSSGNNFSLRNYSFIDDAPNDGFNYYRLRQLDMDGSETISHTVSVKSNDIQRSYSIYPNPANEKIQISYPSNSESRILIFDQNGKMISEKTNAKSIDISHLTSGIYILKIIDKKGNTEWTKRFVKE